MPIKEDAFGATTDTPPAEDPKPAKKKRRSKAQMISDAVIPKDDENVKVVFTATGTEGERPWLEAVKLFREEKVEFKPKDLKYAVEKMDAQRAEQGSDPSSAPSQDEVLAAGAEAPNGTGDEVELDGLRLRYEKLEEDLDDTGKSETEKREQLAEEMEFVRRQIVAGGGTDPVTGEGGTSITGPEAGKKGSENVPPDAEIGDNVRLGSDIYRVGHGGVLTQGPISDAETNQIINPKRTWQRELGTGDKGPWEVVETHSQPASKTNAFEKPEVEEEVVPVGDGEATVQREFVNQVFEQVGPKSWKVGTGVLEKIGLPDYSSLQIGPNTMSGIAIDDGRRIETTMPGGDGRKISIPTSAVEEYQMIADTVEYVTRLQRGHLISFLEAVKPGSTTTPVNS